MMRESPSDDEQTPLIHGHLRVVILLKSGIRRVFHDARLRVGEVVLVAVTGSWHRRRRSLSQTLIYSMRLMEEKRSSYGTRR